MMPAEISDGLKLALSAYIECVIEYEQMIQQELENNIVDICDTLGLTREEIEKSKEKYINNRNSHRLLGTEDSLFSYTPEWLTPQRAKLIKKEMEDYAFNMYESLLTFFEGGTQQFIQRDSSKRFDAEDMFENTAHNITQTGNGTFNDIIENENDPEMIILKCTVLAKHLTLDQVLERRHGLNESQLKRVLYKSYFDKLEQERGGKWLFSIKRWF